MPMRLDDLAHPILTGLIGLVLLAGCRGTRSEEPPVHPNLNMDFQSRFDPQEANSFFADGRSMRTPVEGTVPRGHLRADSAYYRGLAADGDTLEQIPDRVTVDRAFLERGRREFDVYCAPCHGRAGDGNGVLAAGDYAMVPPTSFHLDRLRTAPDGHFFRVITGGVRTMPSYAHQIDVEDRWAIVAYVRALQLSQGAGPDALPEEVRSRLAASPTGASSSN